VARLPVVVQNSRPGTVGAGHLMLSGFQGPSVRFSVVSVLQEASGSTS
jgi:hypothetical protein